MSADMRFERSNISIPAHRVSPLPDVIGLGGAVAGVVAGIAMALVSVLIELAIGKDIWANPKMIAAAIGVPIHMQPGFELGPVVAGTMVHLITSALLGALFGILVRRVCKLPSSFGLPVVTGFIYGLAIWLVAYFIFLPMVSADMVQIYAPEFIIQNITYGIVLGMAYSYLRP